MPKLDRRKLLHAGMMLTLPLGGMAILGGCQSLADSEEQQDKNGESSGAEINSDSTKEETKKTAKEKTMHIEYLEIVTPDVDALVKIYSAIHGVTFSDPIMNLGNARTTQLQDGGVLSIRGPMREDEGPVVRPYTQVDDVEAAIATAKEAGAQIAIEKMEIPGYGTIAMFIQGGIECGLWKKA